MIRRAMGALAVLTTLVVPIQAQEHTAEEEAALAVVHQLFDGMRTKDEALLRGAFDVEFTLVTTGSRDGEPVRSMTPGDRFISSVLAAEAELDEQIWNPVVQVRDNLATVWVDYALFVDGEFSHCGADAFQLFRSSEGWKIFQIADTRQREGCEDPPGH